MNNERFRLLQEEWKTYLWEFEANKNGKQYMPVAQEVIGNYEQEFQVGRKGKTAVYDFETNEVRQFNGAPKEYFYDCQYN